ncbi:MAG: hypothetical protein WB987_11470 [Candidatus Acidiferrales bacterium]
MKISILPAIAIALAVLPAGRPGSPTSAETLALATNPACELTADDYTVYSAILDNLGRPQFPEWKDKRDIILVDATATGETTDGKGWGPSSSTNQPPTPETIKNYNSRVAGSCHLQSRFTAKISPTFISKEFTEKNFRDIRNGWARFYKEHPNASGFSDFSAVGYSGDDQEALVYFGHHCGGLCGTGNLVLLRKENGTWVVKNRLTLWIS